MEAAADSRPDSGTGRYGRTFPQEFSVAAMRKQRVQESRAQNAALPQRSAKQVAQAGMLNIYIVPDVINDILPDIVPDVESDKASDVVLYLRCRLRS